MGFQRGSFFTLFLLAATVYAQSPMKAPNGQAPYTLSTTVRLVITDVSVTDSNGHAVHGLKQSDFEIVEDNRPQTIRSFDEQQPGAAAAPGSATELPQGVSSNVALGHLPNTTNVLLIDSFNTSVADNKFHAIRVRVAGGPYTLHYRSGYVAFPMEDDASTTLSDKRLRETNADLDQLANGGKLARRKGNGDSLTNYNQPGPAAAAILFEARIVPASQVPGWQVLPLERNAKGKRIGNPHDVPYVIEYAALAKDLRFVPTPAGKQHAELIVAALAYTDNGEVVGTAIDRVQINYSSEQMQIANRTGTPLRQQIRLPRGSIFISLALIDNSTGRTGSLEIPFTAAKP